MGGSPRHTRCPRCPRWSDTYRLVGFVVGILPGALEPRESFRQWPATDKARQNRQVWTAMMHSGQHRYRSPVPSLTRFSAPQWTRVCRLGTSPAYPLTGPQDRREAFRHHRWWWCSPGWSGWGCAGGPDRLIAGPQLPPDGLTGTPPVCTLG